MIKIRLASDARGATIIEFAIAAPILIILMIGILQFGMILHASGALRHGLAEGIRHAKVYPDATEVIVQQKTRDALAGIDPNGIVALTFDRGTQNGAAFGRLTIHYEMTPFIPFVPLDVIALTETKTAYLPN